jgi:pimeloyl-ACP methyl ester carboxylesterase
MDREGLPITRSDLVILAHGLDEPGDLWTNLAPELASMGFRVIDFRYPNDQPVHESSLFLATELDSMLGSETFPDGIHLIGHSMGGLVLREFLTHPELFSVAEWKSECPVRTLIQLGTPNHGSWLSTYRLPVELRDHLFKDYGFDALLAMIWDGAGEAQVDLKPGSAFLKELNDRPFPSSIYWAGIAGTGSPANLQQIREWSGRKENKLSESLSDLQATFPELFAGTGDGCVSVDSLHCDDMSAIYYVDAHHRSMVRSNGKEIPPAIPLVKDLLGRRW